MIAACATCRHWCELDGGPPDFGFEVSVDGTGLCRRFPPAGAHGRGDSADAANAAAWPVTWAKDRCGEHYPFIPAAHGS